MTPLPIRTLGLVALIAAACSRSDSRRSVTPADSARTNAAAARLAADSARPAVHCPPAATAAARSLASVTPAAGEAALAPAERSLPRAWGPIALGMTAKAFTSLSGVNPVPCEGAECDRHKFGPHSSIVRMVVDASGSGTVYRTIADGAENPPCTIRLELVFFRDTLASIEEQRHSPFPRDSLRERYGALFGAPAGSDTVTEYGADEWTRGPTMVRVKYTRGPAGPEVPAAGTVLSVTLRDPRSQTADYNDAVAASIRRGDSIVKADSSPPSRTWPLPRGWASISLGMTEGAFALATGVDAKDCRAAVECPDGGAEAYVLVDSTPRMVIFREPSRMVNSAANRTLAAHFYGRRLTMLVLKTRYPAAAPGAPTPFDSLRRRSVESYGQPFEVRKTEDGTLVSWKRGPGWFWLYSSRPEGVDELDVGYLDCRLAAAGDADCRRLSGKNRSP